MNVDKIEAKLEETYKHIFPYIGENDTPILIDMCQHCENWCGKEHDYSECRDKTCFKLFLGYETMIWETSFENGV